MCTTKGANAAYIFEKIENVISHNQIPWDKCVAFSVDNASVNMKAYGLVFTLDTRSTWQLGANALLSMQTFLFLAH
jgi:hypothetical protein